MDRFLTRAPGRSTRHSFSFGASYDPERLSFGPLIALNDEVLGRQAGYDAHLHSDVVLVTWVVFGELIHTDEAGRVALPAGSCLVDRTGTGTTHAEGAGDTPTRFLQMWLRPDETEGEPSLRVDRHDLAAWSRLDLVTDGHVELGVAGATLRVWQLAEGETFQLPTAPFVYAFVVTGALARSSLAQPLSAGDAFEITDDELLPVTAAVSTQLLVWTFGEAPARPTSAQITERARPG